MHSRASGKVGSFSDYVHHLCSGECTRHRLSVLIQSLGIEIVDAATLEISPAARKAIEEYRIERNSYTGPKQVDAEAEVVALVRQMHAGGAFASAGTARLVTKGYFVSNSRVLDRAFNSTADPGGVVCWSPEALYRFINTLPDEAGDPELLQKCMLNEYFYSGIIHRFELSGSVSNASGQSCFRTDQTRYFVATEEIKHFL